MPPSFAEKLTLTTTFSLPVALRGIVLKPVRLEFLSPNVLNNKAME